jgi:uncharacterized repeat protein (TIGR04138 family)
MLDPSHQFAALLKEDKRYKLEAYIFIFEALVYAQSHLGMGAEKESEPLTEVEPQFETDDETEDESEDPAGEAPERHLTGQELCEAIRLYALHQYGLMAKTVLNSWGLHTTGDFGEVVFNLIRIGQMRKTPSDTRLDFENLYDFETAFRDEFRITPPSAER